MMAEKVEDCLDYFECDKITFAANVYSEKVNEMADSYIKHYTLSDTRESVIEGFRKVARYINKSKL